MFKQGDVVIWDGPNKLCKKFWEELSEEQKVEYYGPLGYGQNEVIRFLYLAPILSKGEHSGHCVLVSLDNQTIETMRHDAEFRLATIEEF